jgi:hypothetical protein
MRAAQGSTHRELGLDVARFDRDRAGDAVAARVLRDVEGGTRTGEIHGTPTLFINGVVHRGAHDAAAPIDALAGWLGHLQAAQYARLMARHSVGPRRSDSPRSYMRATRIIGGLSVLVLAGALAWDLTDDEFWARHALLAGLVASVIVVAVTAAVVNEVLEHRQRQRWSVLAQYALFEFISTARLVWTGLLELAGLAPDGDLDHKALAAGSEAVLDSPRLAAAIDDMLADADRREQLHRLIGELLGQSQEVLGRWAGVMVNSGVYAEVIDRHVELYSRLYWWGSVLDESDPLEEHLSRPRLSRLSPATQTSGPVEDEWLRDNLVAIARLAESLDRNSFELAMKIVPIDWWTEQLPDRPTTADDLT